MQMGIEMRLNKYLAESGICSRREADRLIEQGVVLVNGKPAPVGCQVTEQDEVKVRGNGVRHGQSKVVLAYNKPIGVTCTEKDKYAKKTIIEAMKYPVRVTYAGRLDRDSEGLMIMTNDGDLIEKMMRGANHHEKEYVVKVDKQLTEEALETLRNGIYLADLKQQTRPCVVEHKGPYTFSIILTQGLNRQIRRMCTAVGYQVKQLRRVRVMNIKLGNLKTGEYRELTEEERTILYRDAGMVKKAGKTC